MNSFIKLVRPSIMAFSRRGLAAEKSALEQAKALQNFDPHNYSVPIRLPTMEDTMEPYGSWKQAYAAEKKKANRLLAGGILCFSATIFFLLNSGVTDHLVMPNLDNIMEETEPFDFDKEDRITV